MSVIFVLIISVYCALLVFTLTKWVEISNQYCPTSSSAGEFISIIIPVRNEALPIKDLLKSIAAQTFHHTLFEVIVVDDHSEDGTLTIVKGQVLPYKLKTISLALITGSDGKKISGKKQAITQGVLQAKGNIIVTTDADCFMGRDWLKSVSAYFEKSNVKMLVGAVAFQHEQNLFEKIQSIEFAALIGSGAVALKLGKPNMCNGANLAFSKAAFEAVRGYEGNEHIPSGDDEFLLQKIYQQWPNEVIFNASEEGVVYTAAAKNFRTFVNQRKRWAGKWKLHKSLSLKIIAMAIFSFHIAIVASFLAMFAGQLSPIVFVTAFISKGLVEYIYLKKIMNHFDKPLYIIQFIILQAVYSIYVVVFGVMANFGTFDWKGRKYKQ